MFVLVRDLGCSISCSEHNVRAVKDFPKVPRERYVGSFPDCVRSTGSFILPANPNFQIFFSQHICVGVIAHRDHTWAIHCKQLYSLILFNVAWHEPFSLQCTEWPWKSWAEVEASVCFSWGRKRRDASYWRRHRIVPSSLRLTMKWAQFYVEDFSSSSWRERAVSIFWNIYVRIFRMQRLICI